MSLSTHHPLTNYQPSLRSSALSLGRLAGRFSARIDRMARRWRDKAADRAALAWMTERDLRDARVTRWEIERELARPFWRD